MQTNRKTVRKEEHLKRYKKEEKYIHRQKNRQIAKKDKAKARLKPKEGFGRSAKKKKTYCIKNCKGKEFKLSQTF